MGDRPRVLITQSVHEEVLAVLRPHAEVIVNQSKETLSATEVRQRCADAVAMMAFMSDAVDREFLAACPQLKIVAGALKGCDNIDVEGCAERGVWVTIVEDLLTRPTAELAVALLLSLIRNVAPGLSLIHI